MHKYIFLVFLCGYSFAMDKPHYDQEVTDKLVAQMARIARESRAANGLTADFDSVSQLILAGADPNIIYFDGNCEQSLLMFMMRFTQIKGVAFLLDHGADPNLCTRHGSPLNSAIRGNAQLCVELLLQKGAHINHEAGAGTPLWVAVAYGLLPMVKYLLDAGADMHAGSNSAWFQSATFNNLEIFKLLLQHNSQINTNHRANASAIIGAAGQHNYDIHCDIVALLLEKGVSVNARNRAGECALFSASYDARKTKMIKFLLAHGADPNNATNDGRTALMNAAHRGSTQMVQDLLYYGADQSMINKDGQRAIDIAREKGEAEMVNLLQMQKIA